MKYLLLVDDEDTNRDIVEEILMDDYEIKTVTNGFDCLKSIKERIPDLLLLDVGMPDLDGYEVCKKLRANEATKHIPIFLLSAYATREHIERGLSVGADKYISKPFMPDELIAAVNSIFEN